MITVITAMSDENEQLLRDISKKARTSGVIFNNGVPNPRPSDLSFQTEQLGNGFVMSMDFIYGRIKKWLPRAQSQTQYNIAANLLMIFQEMKREGKSDSSIKNQYVRIMSWLYYRAMQVLMDPPNSSVVYYSQTISKSELYFLFLLSSIGSSVYIAVPEQEYLAADQNKRFANKVVAGNSPFPKGNVQDLFSAKSKPKNTGIVKATNVWMQEPDIDQVLNMNRGDESKNLLNSALLIYGVTNKGEFENKLYQWHKKLKDNNRTVLIVNDSLPMPTTQEIAAIHRGNYQKKDDLASDLAKNIDYAMSNSTNIMLRNAFVQTVAQSSEQNLQRLVSSAVLVLCWTKKYMYQLFKAGDKHPIFVLFGSCKSNAEAMFLDFLANTPCDVLLFVPDKTSQVAWRNSSVLKIEGAESMQLNQFPVTEAQISASTIAYNAERDLDTLLYQGTGIYRNRQYQKAKILTLKTMYEEIEILWPNEPKFRPHFSSDDNEITIPVLCEKVSGVPAGGLAEYKAAIARLAFNENLDENLILIIDHLSWYTDNPVVGATTSFIKNRKLDRARIKNDKDYPFSMLREETQEYILDKLQMLLDGELIKGTYKNGTEYTIIRTVLSMPPRIKQMIQAFDFTKMNPKLLFLIQGEKGLSLEESILVAFCNLVGFDIVFFVPTGYQVVEQHFNTVIFEEQQLGHYVYNSDISVSDLEQIAKSSKTKTTSVWSRLSNTFMGKGRSH